MQRRMFLRTTVLVAGGINLVGCGKDDASGGDSFDGRAVSDGTAYFPQSVASGDPRETSVVLWTRIEDAKTDGDLMLMIEVALDEDFTMRVELGAAATLSAKSAHDGCVRVRVEKLEANTTYYYRFAYINGDKALVSRTGRTKTAAAANEDVAVNFAVASCQDYGGRYYHSYTHMAEQDLDFFVHLGDYVYETTGDPEFQSTSGKRKVTFNDTKNAIELSAEGSSYYAASALDNYRDLYKIFRSDPALQRVHELFPMIAISDDHEYSDDCHGQTATYFGGEEDELDPERRSHADQAWFEFMPVDYADPDFAYEGDGSSFPSDLTIYRDFKFGKHVHLVMTDLRRYRGDHLIPEDAFPGAIATNEADLKEALGLVPDFAVAYVDLDDPEYAMQKAALNTNAEALGFVEGDFAGLIEIEFANSQINLIEGTRPPKITAADPKRGISFASMFKSGRFTSVGARYVVKTEPYEAYARSLWLQKGDDAQQIFGPKQEKWFVDTIRKSKQTWKVWGNEYTLMPRRVDLREVPSATLIGLGTLLSLSAEDWDGVPDRRAKILDEIGGVENVVAVTGDIHAFFAGVAQHPEDATKGVIEFVAGAISSASYYELLNLTALSISEAAGALAENAEELLSVANPHLAHLDLARNGYGVFSASAKTLSVTYYAIDGADVLKAKLSGGIDKAFTKTAFRVQAGKRTLLRDHKGKTEQWDTTEGKWIAG